MGGRLLDHAVAALAGTGATELRLFAFQANAPAIAFYRRHGWRPDGTTRIEDEFGEPEIRLRRAATGRGDPRAWCVRTASSGRWWRTFPESPPGRPGSRSRVPERPRRRRPGGRVADHRRLATRAPSADGRHGTRPGLGHQGRRTTTALMRLVSQRHVGLDDHGAAVPADLHRRRAGLVTVRDLLLHRAGLWEWWPLYAADRRDRRRRSSTRCHCAIPSARRRHYSDLGFMLLGRIVATVAASPLDAADRRARHRAARIGGDHVRHGRAAPTTWR